MNSWQLQEPGQDNETANLNARAKSGDREAQYQLARTHDQAGRESEAMDWINQAADGGLSKAVAQLGVWQLLGHNTPRDPKAGHGNVLRAAEAGHIGGQRILATLCAAGLGCPVDWDAARNWLITAAQANDKAAMRTIGFLLGEDDQGEWPGRPLLTKAAADGDLIAQYVLGRQLWDSGRLKERQEAKIWITAAAGWGHRPAGNFYIRIGAPNIRPELPESAKNPVIDWDTVNDRLALPIPIEIPALQRIKTSPRIDLARSFLTPELCDYVMAAADPRLKPAGIIDEQAGEQTDANRRSNSSMAFWILENDVIIESINAAMGRMMGFPPENGETLSVLHYNPGETYSTHFDYCDPNSPAHAKEMKEKGQRVETVLVYLNDDFEGGETRFDAADLSFKGAVGDAIRFYNVTEDGAPDRNTVHTGTPPTKGEKWIISKWVRDKAQF